MVMWPKTVPVLTAENIVRGMFFAPGDRCCLLGWLTKVFDRCVYGFDPYYTATKTLEAVAVEQHGSGNLMNVNDDLRVSYGEVAEVWNEAMRRLGYTEVYEVEALNGSVARDA